MEFGRPVPANRRKKRLHWKSAAILVPVLFVASLFCCEAKTQQSTYHVRRSLAQNMRREEDGHALEVFSHLQRRMKASKSSGEITSDSISRSGKLSKQAKLLRQSNRRKRKGAITTAPIHRAPQTRPITTITVCCTKGSGMCHHHQRSIQGGWGLRAPFT